MTAGKNEGTRARVAELDAIKTHIYPSQKYSRVKLSVAHAHDVDFATYLQRRTFDDEAQSSAGRKGNPIYFSTSRTSRDVGACGTLP